MSENENQENLPKLNIEDENAFKKLKLGIESDVFFKNDQGNLPAEIEGQFLDYVNAFEKQYKNAKRITVYEKIGRPNFKKTTEFKTRKEIKVALHEILSLMGSHNILLDVLCKYKNQETLIYSFITEEFFDYEIDDMNIPGMNTHFIYEEFHPNHRYDLKNNTREFLRMFLNKESDFYDSYHSKDAKNHLEINAFRSVFQKFKLTSLKILTIDFNDKKAKTTFNISFSAQYEKEKMLFSGEGSMTFKYKYNYWKTDTVRLPIKNAPKAPNTLL